MFKTAKQKLQDVQVAESARLVALRLEHEATWPTVKLSFDAEDAKAIKLAAQYTDELAAGSPRASATAIELKAQRWRRDRIKHDFSRRRDELHHRNASITEPVIREFIEFGHALSRETLRLRTVTTEQVIPLVDGTTTYRVRHNENKLSELRERVLACIGVIRAMADRPLAEILNRIEEYKTAFSDFDTTELEAEELNQRQFSDLTARPETPRSDSGIMTADGDVLTLGEPAADRLGRRIAKLQKELAS